MDGSHEEIVRELISFGRKIATDMKMFPYVSFLVKDGVIVARGNNENLDGDISLQDMVVTIRRAQDAIESGDLTGYVMYSFFEPTLTGFDVALWAGVKDFVWAVPSTLYPQLYSRIKYRPSDYAKAHPDTIRLVEGVLQNEAVAFLDEIKEKGYWATV